jgi:hypothetical protein
MTDKTPKKHRRLSADLRYAVEKYCEENEVPEPHMFLLKLMMGEDPRPNPSDLFRLVNEIHQKDPDGLPTQEQWDEIKSYILLSAELYGQPVDITTSKAAAEKLYDSLWPKLKALDVQGGLQHSMAITKPLTDEEAKIFTENFMKEF